MQKATMQTRIEMSQPVTAVTAPPEVDGWGFWQFPMLQRLDDGQVLLEFSKAADSELSYGLPAGQAVSVDDGATWREVTGPEIRTGLRLPNGDLLRAIQHPSPPIDNLRLPKPLACVPASYGGIYRYYRRADLPLELQAGWWFQRLPAGGSAWVDEPSRVEVPDDVVYDVGTVYICSYFERNRIHVAPNGRLVATLYALPQMARGRIVVRRFFSMLVESTDNGRTWRLKSAIPYCPDRKLDPHWDARDGFSEPQITFLPNGSIFALLRTTDGNGIGPLYWARSADGGKSWSPPKVFDDRGVWPQLVTLKNGVTLAAYGRTGLFLRATADATGQCWDRRVTVVEPGAYQTETCSYAALLPLGDSRVLLAYSDFNLHNAEGKRCKGIQVRMVTATPAAGP